MSRKVWKLQDYAAHSGRALCARLGEKSGQVLATGGEDKKVNIWKVGKPNAMMSLQGHTSPVECLVFDKQEEVLVVGCSGGSMQVWNLEYRKMAGTLAGHRTACGAVEFHPYGEFFASGSADTNLKIWDLRRKSCIQTYKGHTGPIHSIRFSPHGRWVATGGQDSVVKLWDLTAGKLMRDLDLHKGAITSIAFHPKEYLLATGSADRTMKMWSLETFQAVGSTDPGTTPVQAVKFWVEESSIVCASQDAMRIYSTDSLGAAQDTVEVDWRGLQDMRLCAQEEKLLALSTEGTQLGVWVAELSRREAAGAGYVRPQPRGTTASGQRMQAPPHRLPRTAASDAEEEDAEQPGLQRVGSSGSRSSGRGQSSNEAFQDLPGLLEPPGSTGACGRRDPAAVAARGAAYPVERLGESPSDASGARGPPPARLPEPRGRGGSADGLAPQTTAAPPRSRCGSTDVAASSPTASTPTAASGGAEPPAPSPPRRGSEAVSAQQIAQLSGQHAQMVGVLQRRLDTLHKLKELWSRGNVAAIGSVLSMPQDQAVFCDFARAVMRQRMGAVLNLDACLALLPILCELVGSKYDDFVVTAAQFVEVLLQNFSKLILNTRSSCARIPERQLDLPREERLRKCNACYDYFRELHKLLPEALAAGRFAAMKASLQTFLQSG